MVEAQTKQSNSKADKADKTEIEQFRQDGRDKVDNIAAALVAGAHSLFITPIVVNRTIGSKINRLPLMSYVNGKNSRFFVPAAIAKHHKANMGQLARAIKMVQDKNLAYIDSSSIDVSDVKAVQDALEEALIKRGDGGVATASLDSAAKIYVRDLKCAKPIAGKGKSRKPVVVPDWLSRGIADAPDKDGDHAIAAED